MNDPTIPIPADARGGDIIWFRDGQRKPIDDLLHNHISLPGAQPGLVNRNGKHGNHPKWDCIGFQYADNRKQPLGVAKQEKPAKPKPDADDDAAVELALASAAPEHVLSALGVAQRKAILAAVAHAQVAAIKAGKVPGVRSDGGFWSDDLAQRDEDLAACRAELAEITSKWYGVKAMYSDAAAACAALTAERDRLEVLLRRCVAAGIPHGDVEQDALDALAELDKPEAGKGGAP